MVELFQLFGDGKYLLLNATTLPTTDQETLCKMVVSFFPLFSTKFFKASFWVWLHLLDLGRRLASKAWFCRGDDGEMRWDDVQVVSFKWLA